MDDISYLIKNFLYERQEPYNGRLDGTLYICKGILHIYPDTKIYKSIYPIFMIIEKYRGIKNKIYYKMYINKNNEQQYDLINLKNKENCEVHFFTKPQGALINIFNLMQTKNDVDNFTFIIEGSKISNIIAFVSNINFNISQTDFLYLNTILNNILTHYEYIDFESHQYYSKVV
jgi:hypothetical protein